MGNFFVGDGSDWMLFMMSCDKILKFFDMSEKKRESVDVLFATANAKISRSKCEPATLIFKNITGRYKGRCIAISKNEFDKMYDIREFIMETVNHYRKVMFSAHEYYNCYIYKSIVQGKHRLECEQIFKPFDYDKNPFDYIRLFYEIPALAPKKVNFVPLD